MPLSYSSIGGVFTPFASPTRRRVPQPVYSHTKGLVFAGRPSHENITFDIVGTSRQGVSMRDVLAKSGSANAWMACANDQVFASSGLKRITLRIKWPGLEQIDWVRSVDVNLSSGPITRAQLAFVVAQNFARFVEKGQYEHSAVPDWRLGQNAIRFDHLVLVSLYNISGDSYQADIAVDPRA
ncbi:hypothetical protein K435DRAFT_371151 [Dendrothele bispora CBS 962.96]|uniref:Uncharacterized protein n=1 Tax=Dendrothele bispora (strain CBS 962.96) TaxID=1314807 RepID=A0A4S8LC61_DENBC|nr:hypothetical protein K435DRAFT_371151 [Dendrothele bispora CBS 962.96]